MAKQGPLKIAIIICSQRSPRVGPSIADFVLGVLASRQPTSTSSEYTLVPIDLKDWPLPMFDEPTIPSHIHDPSSYVQPHTQAWSAEVTKYAAFVFVTPQYNWGYPASVKNAIDYLYNEWKGKPAMIVSYGKRGGGKAAEQLKQVLLGVRMKVAETLPGLPFQTEESLMAAALEGRLVAEAPEMWKSEAELILKAFQELEGLF